MYTSLPKLDLNECFILFFLSVCRLPPIIMFIFITGTNGTSWTSRTSWESWKWCMITSHPQPQHLSTYKQRFHKDQSHCEVTDWIMINIKYKRPRNHIIDLSWSWLILLNQPHGTVQHLTTGRHCWSPAKVGCAQKRSLKHLFLCRGRLVNLEKLENVDLLGLRFVDYYCYKLQDDT